MISLQLTNGTLLTMSKVLAFCFAKSQEISAEQEGRGGNFEFGGDIVSGHPRNESRLPQQSQATAEL